MKTRNGFVSNSSTSSFLIYGTSYDEGSDAIEKLAAKIGLDVDVDDDDYDYEVPDMIATNLGLESHKIDEYSGTYLGMSPTKMADDETMGQFKARVKKILDDATGEDVSCCWHKEAWQNG